MYISENAPKGYDMANMNILSDLKIKKAKSKEKSYTLSDGSGLQLLIKTKEHKLWEFRFKSPSTLKTRKTSFGFILKYHCWMQE